jgi:PAS domain S-box-containing protein
MRLNYLVIAISILCGVIFWISDTVFDYSYYGDQISFLNLLINDVPNHDVHLRPIALMCFLVFGFFVSQALNRAKKADIALKESQKKLQDQNDLLNGVLESLTYPFFVVDVNDYSIKIANSATYKDGFLSTESYCYKLAHNHIKPCGESGETCLIDEIKKNKSSAMFEHIHYDKIGNPRNIEVYGFPIIDDHGNVVQIIEYCIDITKRKHAEMSLQREKERLAVTLRSIGDGVIATDKEGKILLINKVAEELTGWTEEEFIGKKLDEVFCIIHEDTREKHKNPVELVLKAGKVVELDPNTILIAKDKTERIIDDSSSPVRDQDGNTIGVVIVFRDITENRKITLNLQRIDKLESIGILAGGIAHDFNNALMSIMGNISLAMTHSDLEKIGKKLADAERACLRARDLTKQLLIFSKGGVPIKKTELISDFIKESVMFALSGSNVRANFQVPDDLLPVSIDEGLMNQVINNLVINATQAMPDGGKINVYADNFDVNDNSGLPLKTGRYVKMAFEDHGVGISKENLQRVFDPYFTTKQMGLGLGLAESFSIVRKHDGYISVESTIGVGTTFHIYLPASPEALPIKKADTIEEPIKGDGRILLMDDEKYIRDTVAEMLSNLGYKVTTAIDGFEAIQLYLQAKMEGQPYDLVILDLIVPGSMGGEETIQKLKKLDPQIKAIVSSAYASDPIMANFKDYSFNDVIPKPYKMKELSEVVYKVIKT